MGKRKKMLLAAKDSLESSLLVYVLLGIIFYPPFFKGTFFNKELLITHILTASFFLAVMYFRSEEDPIKFLDSPLDILVLGVLLTYIIAGFFGVEHREALKEVYKLINYLLIMILISYFARSKNNVNRIMLTLYVAGVSVAIIGIVMWLSQIGQLSFQEMRVLSTLQYPNTLAAYLVAMMSIGFLLYAKANHFLKGMLIALGNIFIVTAFFGTQSRGGLLLLPFSLLLIAVGPIGPYRKAVITQGVQSLFLGGMVYAIAVSVLSSQNPNSLMWIIGGIFFSGFVAIILERIKTLDIKYVRFGKKLTIIISGIIILVGVIGVIKFADEKTISANRILQISLTERNVVERMIFYKDALEVAKDYPIIGSGGGGWGALYKQYRTYAYNTEAVHNHLLQTLVEVGFIGFAIYLALIILFLYIVFKNIRLSEDYESKTLNWVILTVALSLLAHSAIDFNLSLGAISLLVWIMFGIARGQSNSYSQKLKAMQVSSEKGSVRTIIGSLLTVYIISSAILLLGNLRGESGIDAYNSGQLAVAEARLNSAVKFDPLKGDYKMALARIYMAKTGTEDQGNLALAMEYAKEAVDLDPNDPEKYTTKGNVHLYMAQPDEGVSQYEAAVRLDPTNQVRYEALADIYLKAGKYYAYKKQNDKAREYFGKVKTVPELIEKEAAKIPFSDEMPWVRETYNLYVSDKIKQLVAEAEENLLKL